MKKIVTRVLALLLVCMVFASLPLAVSAAELDAIPYATSSLLYMVEPKVDFNGDVPGMKTTNGTLKQFTPNDVKNSGTVVAIAGNMVHTSSTGEIRSGICYYDSNQKIYIPGVYADTISNNGFSTSTSLSRLVQNRPYYGYIKNRSGFGSVVDGYMTVTLR